MHNTYKGPALLLIILDIVKENLLFRVKFIKFCSGCRTNISQLGNAVFFLKFFNP